MYMYAIAKVGYKYYVQLSCKDITQIRSLLWTHQRQTVSRHRQQWGLAQSLEWRHNERDNVSNHQRLDCFLHRLFRRRSKKTSKHRVTGLCERNPPVTGGFPHKGPVTRKMFSFDDVTMCWPIVDTIVPTLGQRYTNQLCCLGPHRTALMGIFWIFWSKMILSVMYDDNALHYIRMYMYFTIGSASGSRDFTRFGPGGSTLSRFPCKTPIGKVGTSQSTFVTRKLA